MTTECRWCDDLIWYSEQYDCWHGETDRCPEAPGWSPTPEEDAYMAEHYPTALLTVEPGDTP